MAREAQTLHLPFRVLSFYSNAKLHHGSRNSSIQCGYLSEPIQGSLKGLAHVRVPKLGTRGTQFAGMEYTMVGKVTGSLYSDYHKQKHHFLHYINAYTPVVSNEG